MTMWNTETPACVSTITSSDVLCWCETLLLVLGEEHKIDDIREQMAEEDLSVSYRLGKKYDLSNFTWMFETYRSTSRGINDE
jgi:hypothetical protein